MNTATSPQARGSGRRTLVLLFAVFFGAMALAAVLRRAAYLYRQPTDQQRLRVAASWVLQAADEGPKLLAQILQGRAPFPGGSGGSGGSSSSGSSSS